MAYGTQKFETSNSERPTETQRAETAANKFFDMANKINPHMELERQKREMFSTVGTEIAQGNYDKAQRNLEAGAQWNDNLRGVASEVNQLNQERTGDNSISFDEAQKAISGYARDLEKMSKKSGGRQQDLESAMGIDDIVSDTSEPGIEGIEKALEYIEDMLKSKANIADSILKSTIASNETKAKFLKDWQEKRTVRDALYQEKQKRAEQLKQSQQTTEALLKRRGETTRNLENLYANADVPENIPSRIEFFAKISHMSEEELYFLNSALKETASNFGRIRDPKMLDGQLMDLISKSFKREDVVKRQEVEDQKKIEQIRAELGHKGAGGKETPGLKENTTEQQPLKPDGRTEEEIKKARKRIEELMPKKETRTSSPAKKVTKTPESKRTSEESIYERIADTNFEQYRQQKEIMFNGKTWKISSITPDGRIMLHRDITAEEAVSLAERAKKGEIKGVIDTPNTTTKAKPVSRKELESDGQWVVERPPRSPQNPERQKEVDAMRALQARLISGEFAGGKLGEENLLMDIFEKNAQRLNRERQEYETKNKLES